MAEEQITLIMSDETHTELQSWREKLLRCLRNLVRTLNSIKLCYYQATLPAFTANDVVL